MDHRGGAVSQKSTRQCAKGALWSSMPTLSRTLILLAVVTRAVSAQSPRPGTDLPTDGLGPLSTKTHGLVALPIVQSTPALGTGLGGAAVYEFRLDSSPPSSAGAGTLYTTSNSWMFGAGTHVWFHDARRQALGGISIFNANYDFFGVGLTAGQNDHSVPIGQRGDAEMVEFLGVLAGSVYIGPSYLHRGVNTSLKPQHVTDPLAPLANQNNSYQLSALGAAAEYDSRDNEDAPHHGNKSRMSLLYSEGWLGSDQSYSLFNAAINQYFALTRQQVLALRLSACDVGSSAPIWEYCLYGTDSDLRGYQAGRYRDRAMFAAQGEFRSPIVGPLGGALFGGVGGVGNSMSGFTWDHLLPAGGVGLRYLASARRHVTVGIDYAWGRDRGAFYLRIGEAY